MSDEIEVIDDYAFMRELARRLTAFIQRHPKEAHSILIETAVTLKYEVAQSFRPFTQQDEIPVSVTALLSMMAQMPKGVHLGVHLNPDGKIRSVVAAYPDEETKKTVAGILEAAEKVMGSKPEMPEPD